MSVARIIAASALAALCLLSPARAVTSSTAYQANPAHDGRLIMSPGFLPPLHQAWSRDLGGYVGYPVVANGLAFVLVGNTIDDGVKLFALDLQSGKTVWAKPLGTIWFWSSLAYDNGRLFALNSAGLVVAIEADRKGKIAWATTLLDALSEVTAANGHVLVGGPNLHLNSLDEKTGRIEWQASVEGVHSAPAADETGAYFAYPCQYLKFDQATGQTLWHTDTGCHGGGDGNPVYYDHRLFVRDWTTGNLVFDSNTGQKTGETFPGTDTFAIWPQPSGHPALMVTTQPQGQNRLLSSIDFPSGKKNWSFQGSDGDWPVAAPLVVNDMVVVGTAFGSVYLVDAATGHKLWSANTGTAILDDNTNWIHNDGSSGNSRPRSGFGGGEDVLLVPASTLLIAYKP